MIDQEINIAIAEFCGWKDIDAISQQHGWLGGKWGMFPNYCTDLNAMHEAEGLLSGDYRDENGDYRDENSQKAEYSEKLLLVIADGQEVVDVWYWHHIHATAHQRAEALLRTIGKWKE